MFSFVKSLVRRAKKSFKQNQQPEVASSDKVPHTQPPPSYQEVILERKQEIRQLSNEVKDLEKKKEETKHKYMFAESRYLNGMYELNRMQQGRVRDVLEGRRKADDRGYRLATNILKEEIAFLDARRLRLRSDFILDRSRFQKAQSSLSSLLHRYRKDIGYRDSGGHGCCSRCLCLSTDASFRERRRERRTNHKKSVFI